jgi:tRNA-2-methylthio-N6-dimethylallyladenosine synthase
MKKKIFIKTFGCQMNEYDSNRIYDSVKKLGFLKTEDQEKVDCYVLNTCHIRDKAKEKVYHEIGRVKKLYKEKAKPIMIVAGCVAQAENEEMFKREPYIDIIIGPQSYHKINDILKKFVNNQKQEETDFDTVTKFNYFDKIENKNSNVSAFLTIQEGCDKFCHFCVVPYTRGPEYSRPFNQIINEAEKLIENGVKEIVLLGQNVNAYSYMKNSKEYRISNLINKLESYSEIKRIRYTTSHPRDMTDDLIDCYSTSKKLMPFVHLPIQSGSNKILKLMNRKHTVETYIDIYERLKKINPVIEFSSDFIISYPSESEDDFNDTLDLVKKIRFINSFSFIFSPRPGTKAANLNLIDKEISKERLLKIQEHLSKHQLRMNESLINKSIDVLVENKIDGQSKLFGRNMYMNSVIFDGEIKNIGRELKVKIDKVNKNSLFGKIEKKITRERAA